MFSAVVSAAVDDVVVSVALEAAVSPPPPPPSPIDLGTAVHCLPDTVVRKFPAGRFAIMKVKVRNKSHKRKERQPSRRCSVGKASSHRLDRRRRSPQRPRRRRHNSTIGCLRKYEIQQRCGRKEGIVWSN